MVIREAVDECRMLLNGKTENPALEAGILAQFVLGMDRLRLSLSLNEEISSESYARLRELARRRSFGEPVAYITGHKEFMSLDFRVCPGVLIPRPDTEILVETVIEKFRNEKIKLLDLCTGSGAIACSLAHYIPGCTAVGVDISETAVQTATDNSDTLGLGNKTKFFKKDVFEITENFGLYDVAVSNPPYIESEIIETLDKDVKDFEPGLALDGGKDGLMFYRAIVRNAPFFLKKGGMMYFEIGYNQAKAVHNIMCNTFKNIKIIKDYGNNDRVISGQLV